VITKTNPQFIIHAAWIALFLFIMMGHSYAETLPRAVSNSEIRTPLLGQSRPHFSLPDIQGKMRHIDEWNGKLLVINFWATWCEPCKKEMPMFNRLQSLYGDDGVQFIGVAVDNQQAVNEFMQQIPIEFPVLIGDLTAVQLVQTYGNQAGVLPYTIFVDKNGKIFAAAQGGLTRSYASRTIEKQL